VLSFIGVTLGLASSGIVTRTPGPRKLWAGGDVDRARSRHSMPAGVLKAHFSN